MEEVQREKTVRKDRFISG